MIHILCGDSNTFLGNTGGISTTTGALKPLTNGQVYKLVWNGTKWIKFT